MITCSACSETGEDIIQCVICGAHNEAIADLLAIRSAVLAWGRARADVVAARSHDGAEMSGKSLRARWAADNSSTLCENAVAKLADKIWEAVKDDVAR